MSFDSIKAAARQVGLYRTARWVNRHIINRDELRSFKEERQFYRQFVQPGSMCFDVGANYGTKAEVFLALGAKVIAFEPQPDCMAELRARLGARVTTIQAAVGSRAGRMTMYVQKHRANSTFVTDLAKPADVVGTIDVNITTLDEAIATFGLPQFCKIDVEGFEEDVLRGLSQRIPMVSFEYHAFKPEGATRALACLAHLSTLGAVTVNVAPAETPALASTEWLPLSRFEEFFRNTVTRPGFHYGDIFARIAAP